MRARTLGGASHRPWDGRVISRYAKRADVLEFAHANMYAYTNRLLEPVSRAPLDFRFPVLSNAVYYRTPRYVVHVGKHYARETLRDNVE